MQIQILFMGIAIADIFDGFHKRLLILVFIQYTIPF